MSRTKSKVCIFWLQPSGCPYADRCLYAHGVHEMRRDDPTGTETNDRYKSRLCKHWLTSEGKHCPHGVRCTFAHGPVELEHYQKQHLPSVFADGHPEVMALTEFPTAAAKITEKHFKDGIPTVSLGNSCGQTYVRSGSRGVAPSSGAAANVVRPPIAWRSKDVARPPMSAPQLAAAEGKGRRGASIATVSLADKVAPAGPSTFKSAGKVSAAASSATVHRPAAVAASSTLVLTAEAARALGLGTSVVDSRTLAMGPVRPGPAALRAARSSDIATTALPDQSNGDDGGSVVQSTQLRAQVPSDLTARRRQKSTAATAAASESGQSAACQNYLVPKGGSHSAPRVGAGYRVGKTPLPVAKVDTAFVLTPCAAAAPGKGVWALQAELRTLDQQQRALQPATTHEPFPVNVSGLAKVAPVVQSAAPVTFNTVAIGTPRGPSQALSGAAANPSRSKMEVGDKLPSSISGMEFSIRKGSSSCGSAPHGPAALNTAPSTHERRQLLQQLDSLSSDPDYQAALTIIARAIANPHRDSSTVIDSLVQLPSILTPPLMRQELKELQMLKPQQPVLTECGDLDRAGANMSQSANDLHSAARVSVLAALPIARLPLPSDAPVGSPVMFDSSGVPLGHVQLVAEGNALQQHGDYQKLLLLHQLQAQQAHQQQLYYQQQQLYLHGILAQQQQQHFQQQAAGASSELQSTLPLFNSFAPGVAYQQQALVALQQMHLPQPHFLQPPVTSSAHTSAFYQQQLLLQQQLNVCQFPSLTSPPLSIALAGEQLHPAFWASSVVPVVPTHFPVPTADAAASLGALHFDADPRMIVLPPSQQNAHIASSVNRQPAPLAQLLSSTEFSRLTGVVSPDRGPGHGIAAHGVADTAASGFTKADEDDEVAQRLALWGLSLDQSR